MPNGTLKLYNKLNNTLLVSLDILGTFNIEDNLNETPSNMKVKVITSNVYREEFQVNTIAYHEDTNSWWVIKSDESSYMTTGEYEHEIQLIEYLEFYAYRHLPNCAFAPNTYTLEQMLLRLFDIAKLSITVVYPNFLDKDKIMPFFSFENFTVANAIKNIGRAINAIPKMSINLTGFVPTLTFINRNGADNAIVNVLDTQFPIAYEKNMNSNDQFTTRSVSNITNAKSSSLVISPQKGGYKNISIESSTYVADTAKIYLPSKIDSVKQLNIYPRVSLVYITFDGSNLIYNAIYKGYFFDEAFWFQKFQQSLTTTNKIKLYDSTELTITSTIYNALNALTINDFPTAKEQSLVNSTDTINTAYNDTESPWFKNKMIIKSKFDFNLENTSSIKNRISYFEPNLNTIVMSKQFREGLVMPNINNIQSSSDINPLYKIYRSSSSIVYNSLYLVVDRDFAGLYNDKTFSPNILVQVSYYPIADIKVSIDNDNDAQDEKFFNQSGKVIDAVSVSKLVTSHTNDSVEGTKIRNARYDKFPYQLFTGTFSFGGSTPPTGAVDGTYWFSSSNILRQRISGSFVIVEFTFGTTTPVDGNQSSLRFVNTATQQLFISQLSILPLGQLVRDSNQLYVITQRSIDGMVKNSNEYYNVIYTLSRNRIARSENIVADSSVISYKTPDDNLIFRTQLYKDYIELSLNNNNQEAPYLIMSKALVLSDTLAGTNFDYTVLAKNSYGTTPTIVRYVKNPTIFDLHKAKLMNVNWQYNNIIDYRVERNNSQNPIQTPILYTDNLGKATNFELLFCDTLQIEQANEDYNKPTEIDPLVPFGDLTQVPTSFYTDDVLLDGRFSIRIQEDTSGGRPYQKDPFEIPVFEYMIQGNDDYSNFGNIVIGNDLFTTFTGTIRYHYVVNNTTRFTAENANKLYTDDEPLVSTVRRVVFVRNIGTPHILDLDLYIGFSSLIRNSSAITNIGIYATDGTTVKFLFAINDYVENATTTPANDKSNIRVFINNWKI